MGSQRHFTGPRGVGSLSSSASRGCQQKDGLEGPESGQGHTPDGMDRGGEGSGDMGEPSELRGKSQAEDLCRLGSENRPLRLRVRAGGLTGSMGPHAFARYPWAGHPNKASVSANFRSCLWPGMGLT